MVLGWLLSYIAPNSSASLNLYPPASKFVPARDIPDLSGKIFLVTGGNTGIGYETVKELLKKNGKVYLAARSAARANAAIDQLEKDTGKSAIFLELDLNDLKSVRKAADVYAAKESRLDCLILNAGIMGVEKSQLTAQGYDAHFGPFFLAFPIQAFFSDQPRSRFRVNVVGHYLFGSLLMPQLSASTKQFGEKARIVSLSSALTSQAPGKTGIVFDSLTGGSKRDEAVKSIGGVSLYGQAKLGNAMTTTYFADMNPDVAAASLHPGVLRSEISRDMPRILGAIVYALCYPVEYGALTTLYAATAVPADTMNRAYFLPWARFGKVDPKAENPETLSKLKTWLDEAVKGF